MTWVRIDDRFPENEKIIGLKSVGAKWLHVVALCQCASNLTDGRIDPARLKVICAIADVPRPSFCIRQLVEAGLWVEVGNGAYQIKDYLEYNPSAEAVKTERRKARERMGKNRARNAGSPAEDVDYRAVYDRDKGICRICGRHVEFDECEFDHIIPISAGGAHTEDNLAATHRACNRAKRTKGPEFTRGSFGVRANTDAKFADPLPLPHPLSSKEEAPARDAAPLEGTISNELLLARLVAAAGGGPQVAEKVANTLRGYRISEFDLTEAIRAATGPGVKDRLAVALSELAKRRRKAA